MNNLDELDSEENKPLTISLEDRYQHYLKLASLSEDTMHPVQKVETKNAFMGGCLELLVVLINDINEMEEEESIKALDDIFDQVKSHFEKQISIQKKPKEK